MSRKLRTLIRAHKLTKFEENILALSGNGGKIKAVPTGGKKLRTGASKFGALPDVPKGFRWPMRGKRPLAFVAQIDLAALPKGICDWPASGSLLFFYDVIEQPWGFDPQDHDASRVVYIPKGVKRAAMAMPKAGTTANPTQHVLDACEMTFSKVMTIPPPENPAVAGLFVNGKDRAAYQAMYDELFPAFDDGHHQAFGWPSVVQGDMEMECQLAFHGIDCGGMDDSINESLAATYAMGAARWNLLLQVAYDENLGAMFGDMGRLYFYVAAESRADLSFKDAWTILQCG